MDQKELDTMNTEFVLAVQKYPLEERPQLMRQYTQILDKDGTKRARSFMHAMEATGPQ